MLLKSVYLGIIRFLGTAAASPSGFLRRRFRRHPGKFTLLSEICRTTTIHVSKSSVPVSISGHFLGSSADGTETSLHSFSILVPEEVSVWLSGNVARALKNVLERHQTVRT